MYATETAGMCGPAATDYQPRVNMSKDDVWPACVTDSGAFAFLGGQAVVNDNGATTPTRQLHTAGELGFHAPSLPGAIPAPLRGPAAPGSILHLYR